MKLFTNMTKPLVLFVLLFALGVGQMWAGTKRIYCEYSGVSSWWGTVYVYAWGAGKDAKKYTTNYGHYSANTAQKLIRNGSVYILTDDSRTYTITGQQVK